MFIEESDRNYIERIVTAIKEKASGTPDDPDELEKARLDILTLTRVGSSVLDAVGARYGVLRRKLHGRAVFETKGLDNGNLTLSIHVTVNDEDAGELHLYSGPPADLEDYVEGRVTMEGIAQRWSARRSPSDRP